ncbi:MULTISPECIES: hypothetical protein [unclassified Exiguobacterium]|nr:MULTISPECIES: hypothetical protein [unclassified Exiguobacterium]
MNIVLLSLSVKIKAVETAKTGTCQFGMIPTSGYHPWLYYT